MSPSDGGFLVPETLRSQLLQIALEMSVVRPLATVVPMDSARVPFPMIDSTSNATSVFGGMVAYWGEEGAALTDASPKFGRAELDAKKLTGLSAVPNELLQDSIVSFSALIDSLWPKALAFEEDAKFMAGSGVGEPLRAEIEILAVRPGEAASLGARIPPAEVFWRANIEPSPALGQIRVRVERRPKDRHVVVLSSNEPFEDPFLQLLVELTSAARNVVREYSFLLDEPRTRAARGGAAPAPRQAQTEPLAETVPTPAAAEAAECRAARDRSNIGAQFR